VSSATLPCRPRRRPSGAGSHLDPALLGSRRARHVIGRNLAIYRRGWYFVLSGAVEPVFYLASIGIGLSHLVGAVTFAGHRLAYPAYAAPGLLASAAMNGAIVDTTFSVFFRLKIAKSYESVLSTPLGTGDVALGEIGWSVLRGTLYSACFLVFMAAFGYLTSWWALCCLPAAVLIGFAFAAGGMAATCYVRNWSDLDNLWFLILPLFLFSGTFYPITIYPAWLTVLVRWSPLYQGVTLERGLASGIVFPALAGHAAYLALLALASLLVVGRRLRRRLTP
jgi:lipooligosaccharide transport system permease protein